MQNKLQKQFLTHIKLDSPLELFILPAPHSPTGLLAQQERSVEWIYTHFRGTKSITPYLDLIMLINGRKRAKTLIGSDPHKIGAPINKSQFKNTLQTSIDFQIAFWNILEKFHFIIPLTNSGIPSKILNLFSLTLSHHNLYLKLMFSV